MTTRNSPNLGSAAVDLTLQVVATLNAPTRITTSMNQTLTSIDQVEPEIRNTPLASQVPVPKGPSFVASTPLNVRPRVLLEPTPITPVQQPIDESTIRPISVPNELPTIIEKSIADEQPDLLSPFQEELPAFNTNDLILANALIPAIIHGIDSTQIQEPVLSDELSDKMGRREFSPSDVSDYEPQFITNNLKITLEPMTDRRNNYVFFTSADCHLKIPNAKSLIELDYLSPQYFKDRKPSAPGSLVIERRNELLLFVIFVKEKFYDETDTGDL